jgi:hypothetical protein
MHPIASRRFVPTAFVLFVAALTFAGVAAVIALVSTIGAPARLLATSAHPSVPCLGLLCFALLASADRG